MVGTLDGKLEGRHVPSVRWDLVSNAASRRHMPIIMLYLHCF
jgi:hypothetical protein